MKISRIMLFITAVGLLSCHVGAVEPLTDQQFENEIYKKFPSLPGRALTQEEYLNYINDAIKQVAGNTEKQIDLENLQSMQKYLIEKLKGYKVTGVSVGFDPNFAFIWDRRNPSFNIRFTGDNGEIKTRRYDVSIDSIGFKFEFNIRFEIIFFVDTDLNFYDFENKILLGEGVEVGIPALAFGPSFTYVPFLNNPGGMCIFSFGCGPSVNLLSKVTGGSITPATT
jgi:hypothetical protein